MNGSELAMSEWEYLLNNNLELKFTYTNYKNDIRERYVGSPMSVEYMIGDKRFYHNDKPKFFLRAFDLEKQEYRDFSLERMNIDPEQKEVLYTGLKGKIILKDKYKSLAERYEFEWNMWLPEAPELKDWSEYSRSSFITYGALCYMPYEWDEEPIVYNNGEWFLCCSLKNYENTICYFITKVLPIIADSWDLEELYEEDDNPTKHQHNVESKYE